MFFGNWSELLFYFRSLQTLPQRVGIDIGGTLTSDCDVDSSLPYPDVFPCLQFLKENRVELYIISFCGKRRAPQSYQWLQDHGIVPTYIDPLHVFFCTGDPCVDKYYLGHYLELDFYIDDRSDILEHIDGYKPLNVGKNDGRYANGPRCLDRERWPRIRDLEFTSRRIATYLLTP